MVNRKQNSPKVIEIFYSYSHKDTELRNELDEHLSLLKRQGIIKDWHDQDIDAGQEWKQEINQHLESAHIILLLISSHFLASDYCYEIEMKRAMERHKSGEACVIPVILHDCDWYDAPFGRFQALPRNGEPVTGKVWTNRHEAFKDVAIGIKKAIKRFQATYP
jgi:hypothetical protein